MTKEEIKSLINNKIGGQGNQVDLGGALKSVLNELVEGGESMESITWAELKAKRDEGKLVAGAQYRITDYECTTTQENTFAASHKFDIIVTADDERTLNENARAIPHSGDIYFATSNLSAWELKYCLDNDSERFAWAQRGGIESMSSGFSNGKPLKRCPDLDGKTLSGHEEFYYAWGTDADIDDGDATNFVYSKTEYPKEGDEVLGSNQLIAYIPFAGKGVIYYMKDEWNNECPYDFKNIMFNGDWGYFAYTFNWINDESDNSCEDLSVAQFVHKNDEGGYSHTYGNVIKPYGENGDTFDYGYPYRLNFIVFLNRESYDGGNYYGCYSNTFGDGCYSNTFGDDCYSNTFGNGCYSNTFGDDCVFNTFGKNCDYNTFGDGCYSNTFGDACHSNTFGNDCHNNIFRNECSNNSFGDECHTNTFERGDSQNIFGYDCTNITFGKNCTDNILGNNNKFITFGDDCSDNELSGENGNIRYVYVLAGVNSVSIQVQENASFPQFVARNSSGGIRTWAPAD